MLNETNIKRALVTGGAGFVGSNLVRELLRRRVQVVVYDNFSTGRMANLPPTDIQIYHGCVTEQLPLLNAMRGCDAVFHFAGHADVRGGRYERWTDMAVNTGGTHHALEAAVENKVKTFVLASSAAVYGDALAIPTPETYAPTQTSVYGASKLAAEGLAQAYAEYFDFNLRIYRFVSLLGPGYWHGVVADFVQRLKENPKQLTILGNGNQRKSFLDVYDAITGVFAGLRSTEKKALFNVGHYSFLDVIGVAKYVMQAMNLSDVELLLGSEDRGWPGDAPFVHLDTSELRMLDWQTEFGIGDAILRTVQYLLAQ